MKKEILKNIIKKKKSKIDFAVVTDLKNGDSFIFEKNKPINKKFKQYTKKIIKNFDSKRNGIIEKTNIFIKIYNQPTKVIIVGAVHIAQYLVNFMKPLNFEIYIIDPRSRFATKERFKQTKVINKWPNEAFYKIKTNNNSALIALSHDPKIDDQAIEYAIKNNFYYIGALGSKKTHKSRCKRLKENGLTKKQIKKIFSPVGIKLGGKSTPEIALSIVAQIIFKIYN